MGVPAGGCSRGGCGARALALAPSADLGFHPAHMAMVRLQSQRSLLPSPVECLSRLCAVHPETTFFCLHPFTTGHSPPPRQLAHSISGQLCLLTSSSLYGREICLPFASTFLSSSSEPQFLGLWGLCHGAPRLLPAPIPTWLLGGCKGTQKN